MEIKGVWIDEFAKIDMSKIMTKKFSVLKLSDVADPEVVCETHSHYEAKHRFRHAPVDLGEQIVLRSHLNGEVKILNVRNNGHAT